jgi:ribosome biogenesis GTPase A
MLYVQGGQPDIGTVARQVLNDWQRGKIPFYVKPPDDKVRICCCGDVCQCVV